MNTKELLEKVYQQKNLASEEIQFLLGSCINDEMTDAQIAAFLIGLRMKGETVEEIGGLIQGMRKHIVQFPEFPNAIDTCGTGGDGSGTFNISTTVAFVVAGAGVPVAKHGNKSASSKCGSADVLSELGVNIMLAPELAKEVLKKVGMVFLFAPLYHPAMKRIGPIRKELGTRTVFNFLGPFLNPAKVKRQLIGIPSVELAKTLAKVAVGLGYENLLLVTSDSGMDEIALSGTTQLFEIQGGKIIQKTVDPQKLGFKKVSSNAISGGDIAENAKIIMDILNGVKSANRDIVVLNGAYALVVAGKVSNVQEGIAMAEKSIDSGAAKKVLENLKRRVKDMPKKSQISNLKSQTFLEKIIEKKREELSRKTRKNQNSGVSEYQNFRKSESLSFLKTFDLDNKKKIGLIAEVKFASPTSLNLGSPKDLLKRVKEYEKAGADAISIITEKHYFNGDISFVSQAKKHVDIPVLQKDFVIDPSQIYEAREIGSDALLLIAKLVDKKTLHKFVELCFSLGIEPVVEIANEEDLKKAIATQANIIAVNARDLETFVIDVEKTCILMKRIPDRFIKIGFSGVYSRSEVLQYQAAGAKGVLVGTSLMQAKNIGEFIASLRQSSPVKVKICATRSLEAAKQAADSGAEFLGMVFTPKIKTHTVTMQVAQKIGKVMKGKINLVGVFQNMPLSEVQEIISECSLDYAQFHGDESPEYIKEIKIKVIKAFRFPGSVDLKQAREQMKKYDVDYYLVDRIKQSEGPMLDVNQVSILAKEFPMIFAGGLNPENVAEVILIVKPEIVDVASGVETDGLQDLDKIQKFITNSKGVSL